MTLDELLQAARRQRDNTLRGSRPWFTAQAVLDMLSESQPCGFEAPTVVSIERGSFVVMRDVIGPMTPAETRAYAAMLLRAADEADADALSAGGGR